MNAPSQYLKGRRAGERGATLLVLLLTIGGLGIGLWTLRSSSEFTFAMQKNAERGSDLWLIRQAIAQRVNCEKSTRAGCPTCKLFSQTYAPCPSGSCTAELQTNAGGILVAGDASTMFGGWLVKAEYTADGLDVKAAKPKAGGGFQTDPVRNIPYDFMHPRSRLFPLGEAPCQEHWPPPPPATYSQMLYGGVAVRHAYGPITDPPFYELRDYANGTPASPNNSLTGTKFCPEGYTAELATEFLNAECRNRRYSGSGWHKTDSSIPFQPGTHPDSDQQCETADLSDCNWIGCGLRVYYCYKLVR